MSLVLDEHRHYLADRPRLEAYAAALRALVRPGDVVLDLACGTGILGFLACNAGARHVYAVDNGPIIDVARRLAAANGYADRLSFMREISTRVMLPEPVDLVVCDQVGHLGIEAGVFEYLLDARRRFLKPGGRTIPGALTFVAAPARSEDVRARVAFWASRPAGLDAGAVREIAINTGYPLLLDRDQLLAEPAAFAHSALPPSDLAPIRGQASWTIETPGVMDGVCAWFLAELAPGITMTNAPGDPARIDRRHVMLPIASPVPVQPGDTVIMDVSMVAPDSMVNWRVTVEPRDRSAGSPVTYTHSTFKGMLLSAEDLARTAPGFRPTLTSAGMARRTVLELCDGERPLRAIEDEVFARYPHLFGARVDASTFVAEVVTRYSAAHAAVPDREPDPR